MNHKNTDITHTPYHDKIYICSICGPFLRVIIEHWFVGDDGPTYVDLIHHEDKKAIVAHRLQIREPKDGQFILYKKCGECGSPMDGLFNKDSHPQWKSVAMKCQGTKEETP